MVNQKKFFCQNEEEWKDRGEGGEKERQTFVN